MVSDSNPGRRGKSEKAHRESERLHQCEREAVREAKQLGLWVLIDGSPSDRITRLYALPLPQCIGWYSFAGRKYSILDTHGVSAHWRDALRVAADIVRRAGGQEPLARPA
jgi:hypothetical protein